MQKQFYNYIRYEKRYSSHTLNAYKTDLQQFSDFLKKQFEIEDLTKANFHIIRSWIVHLSELQITPLSINRKVATLKSFYKFLLKNEHIEKNPTLRIKPLKTPKTNPTFIDESKFVNLLKQFPFTDTFEGLRDKLVLEILYGTGIRLAELLHLKFRDVNFSGQYIKVKGKRNKERIIPITKALLLLINQYEDAKKTIFAIDDDIPECLIFSDTGKAAYPMLIYRIVKKYLALITSQDKKSPHVLRHSFATHLLNKGADLNAIKDLLGHANLSATQVYTHNSLDKLKSAFKQAHPKA